jgi:hypothetical protein
MFFHRFKIRWDDETGITKGAIALLGKRRSPLLEERLTSWVDLHPLFWSLTGSTIVPDSFLKDQVSLL